MIKIYGHEKELSNKNVYLILNIKTTPLNGYDSPMTSPKLTQFGPRTHENSPETESDDQKLLNRQQLSRGLFGFAQVW